MSQTKKIPSPPLVERVRVRGQPLSFIRIDLSTGPLTPALSPKGGEGEVVVP